ncbi:MAG: lysophospholipid acyltransferase family protein [Anaerolineae bacterium]|nr:lysophospholipid acyltransferase family protein [Anaerolineae bacterium]MDK1080625.1 lysophospholipid acyltransferase family protein [Anaerolineae bacterium]MDK1117581.1 lysophospholipid acyltransferase family protein [Anaerolineae bacterium]
MPTQSSSPPKPLSEVWRPELTRLPRLHRARRWFRIFGRGLCKFIITIFTRRTIEGLENFPKQGPALVVINHLGDVDSPLLVASIPASLDALGKIELYYLPVLGKMMDWYGVIWLHRGRADRRAMRAALDGLAQGRIIVIAPEGRYSLMGRLEEGGQGAAFLALKAQVPIVPVVMIGTENEVVYGHIKQFKRAPVRLRVGKAFRLSQQSNRRVRMREGTRQIMESLARLLPESYRGDYRTLSD